MTSGPYGMHNAGIPSSPDFTDISGKPWIIDVLSEAARNRLVLAGTVIAILMTLLAVFAPVLSPHDPNQINPSRPLEAPSAEYPFGTDNLGRDTLSRVFYGLRTSLLVSCVSVFMGTTIGSVTGLFSGYLGGMLDAVVSRVVDVFLGIPTLLLAIALSAVLGSGLLNPIIAIAIINVPFFARMVRGSTLAEKTKQYIRAAKAIGANDVRIMLRYILPNVVPSVIVQSTLNLSYAVLVEASLGFVGLGVQPPTPSLGSMLSGGRTYLEQAPWFSIFPGLAIVVLIMAFNLAGDGIRDALDPMIRGVR